MEHERNKPEDERNKIKDEDLDNVSGGRGGPEMDVGGARPEGGGMHTEGVHGPGNPMPEGHTL